MESYPLGVGVFTDLERHLALLYSQQERGVLFNPLERHRLPESLPTCVRVGILRLPRLKEFAQRFSIRDANFDECQIVAVRDKDVP